MRQYKFRGKRIDNGEWVYGFFVGRYDPHQVDNVITDCYIYDGCGSIGTSVQVIPETVGQFTGLQANGKDQYEGDKCRCRMVGIEVHQEEVITEIIYDPRACGFGHKVISRDSDYVLFGLNSEDLLRSEVIGNIHEPELSTREEGKEV